MEEAYRYIEWKAVFLIAGMFPLRAVLERPVQTVNWPLTQ